MSVGTACTFNGQSLQTFDGNHGILLQQIQHAGKSAKRAVTYALSHGNQTAIPYTEYPAKPILLHGQVIGTTIADCDSLIDTFNSYLTPTGAPLIFDYNGGSLNRQYTATCTNIDVDRPGGLAYATFDLVFTGTLPYGQDTTTTTLLSTGARTLQSYSDTLTFGGSFPFQLPKITVTFSALSDTTGYETVSVGNGGTGQQISVNRIWAATDVLLIDCTLSSTTPVTVNGLPVEFSGAFPDFAITPAAMTGNLTYADTFTSRSFTELAIYYKYWL